MASFGAVILSLILTTTASKEANIQPPFSEANICTGSEAAGGRAESCVDNFEVLLLQTALQVDPLLLSNSAQRQELLLHPRQAPDIELLSPGVIRAHYGGNATGPSNDFDLLSHGACQHYRAVEDRILEGTLRLLGGLPETEVCREAPTSPLESPVLSLHSMALISSGLSALGMPRVKNWLEVHTGYPIIYLFIMAFGVFVVFVLFSLFFSLRMQEPRESGDKDPLKKLIWRPESEAWNYSIISWLLCSWASSWIIKWGIYPSEAPNRINSEDLGQYGDEEDETVNTVAELERLFMVQSALDPRQKESLSWTMVAFAGRRRLIIVVISTCCHQALMYIGPVVLVDHTMKYLHQLGTMRVLYPGMVTNDTLFEPLLALVLGFVGLPILTALFATISFTVNLKLNIRLMGALSAAVFRKAQRLPVATGDRNLDGQSLTGEAKASTEKHGFGGGSHHYSLVQLNATDIAALLGIQFAVAKVLALGPIVIILAVMLFMHLKMATFATVAASIILFYTFTHVMRGMVGALMTAQAFAGSRLSLMQETMFGVRVIKSYAWEEPCLMAINNIRGFELASMWYYWVFTGMTGVLFQCVARVVTFVSIGTFVWLYSDIASSDIFTMMQVLNAFRNSVNNFSMTAPTIINAGPSVLRISNFLKLDEASIPNSKHDCKEKWVKVWPRKEQRAAESKLSLSIKGSWAATGGLPTDAPLLHDIDITIPQGQMVAVLGEVGAGKSILLQGMLGELLPLEDASIEISEKIAYHAQVPMICEATLRENIIYWSNQDDDEDRYREAVFASSLTTDLQVLPGGDKVIIGSRGISLSGGQKARVSLARAAYNKDAEVVLLDDPFASVDAPTAQHLLRNLLLGPLMSQRTLVVVCQPEKERIASFDRVIILAGGRVIVDGTPAQACVTPAFMALLSKEDRLNVEQTKVRGETQSYAAPTSTVRGASATMPLVKRVPSGLINKSLREEESEGRADMKTLHFFCQLGHYRLVVSYIAVFIMAMVMGQLADTVFARWTNVLVASELYHMDMQKHSMMFLAEYFGWVLASGVVFMWCFMLGAWWSLRISRKLFGTIVEQLFQAPIDFFHDKTPVGRIMNRMTYDMSQADYSMYSKMSGAMSALFMIITPLVYIHIVLPLFCTLVALPFHYMFFMLVRSYWRVMVPLRYLTTTSRSLVANCVTEVEHTTMSYRAYQVAEALSLRQIMALEHTLRADFAANSARRWAVNRLTLLWACLGGGVSIVCVMMPGQVQIGFASLCLMNIVVIIGAVDFSLENATNVQFEFVSMNRLHEYTSLPQEQPHLKDGDEKYRSYIVELPRSDLGPLESVADAQGLIVVRAAGKVTGSSLLEPCGLCTGRSSKEGPQPVILQLSRDGKAMVPGGVGEGITLAILAPGNKTLEKLDPWHRIVCVNGGKRDPATMVEDLCYGTSPIVRLDIQSGWLTNGASVQFDSVRVGYGDVPRDVLRGINFTIERKCKTAVAGTTGCGKSTMMLALLRIIEPRGGRILIEGVNIQMLGLQTLRRSLGLVPQDPVIFNGSIRKNLDPFQQFSDQSLWACLTSCQMAQHTVRLGGLDAELKADGENLSFGQRQLMCIARMVLRQPALLLLDEATSAIDPATQETVQNTIKAGFPDSTIFAIAHRLETILDFDMVIVLDKGEIVEMGPVSELKDLAGGRFNKMLAAKYEEMDNEP